MRNRLGMTAVLSAAMCLAGQASGTINEVQDILPPVPTEFGGLGASLDVDGNTMVVGTSSSLEEAYVYERATEFDLWVHAATLTASDPFDENDNFGFRVAIDGDVIVVSSNKSQAGNERGQVYVYVKPAGGWVSATEDARLNHTETGQLFSQFGNSVDIDGDTIMVAAPRRDTPSLSDDRGSVYTFDKPAGGWSGSLTPTQRLDVSESVEDLSFGYSAALSGDVIVASSIFAGDSNQGAAWVFERVGGTWVERGRLTSSAPEATDFFGYEVDVDGDTVVVGAQCGGPSCAGEAFVFEKPAGGWITMTETLQLPSPIPGTNNTFGEFITVQDDFIAVSALSYSSQRGRVIVYERLPGGGWVQRGDLERVGAMVADRFGESVAIDGVDIVISASNAEAAGLPDGSGRIFSYKVGGPSPFGLQTPAAGAMIETGQVAFTWDVAANADTYTLLIDDDADLMTPAFMASGLTATGFTLMDGDLPDGDWHWGVMAMGEGQVRLSTPSSQAFNLTTVPGSFDLLSPGESAFVETSTPDLAWSSSARATSYRLLIDDDPSFASPLVDATIPVTSWAWPSGSLPAGVVHNWKVIASNQYGDLESGVRQVVLVGGGGPSTCPGDVNGDNAVNFDDLNQLLENWENVCP